MENNSMFIKTASGKDANGNSILLTFLKSVNVQAYPCGRRRSTQNDITYQFPFDPEARLNTEANNRKHSGINGFTQTYVKGIDNGVLALSLAGYLFSIKLPESNESSEEAVANFGDSIINAFDDGGSNNISRIYANILIEDTQLFSGFADYYTSILRDQSGEVTTKASLDLLASDDLSVDNYDNYYFSGLSFSAAPLTCISETRSYIINPSNNRQCIVSICVLEKVDPGENGSDTLWKIYQPALLPKIEHGTTKDSVMLGDTRIERKLDGDNVITEGNITVDNKVSTKDLTASGIITATETLENETYNIVASKTNVTDLLTAATADIETADIATLTGTTAEVTNITGTSTVSSPNIYQNGYKVPIIELVQSGGTEYQLKISRIGAKPQS
jgi:hypothetical protein